MQTFGPTEFLKAIEKDLDQVVTRFEEHANCPDCHRNSFHMICSECGLQVDFDDPDWSSNELRRIISEIREKISNTQVTTIAGTTVISTTTDESK